MSKCVSLLYLLPGIFDTNDVQVSLAASSRRWFSDALPLLSPEVGRYYVCVYIYILSVCVYIYILYAYISLSTAPLWFSASAGSGWESPLVSPVSGMPKGWSPGSGRYLTNNLAEISANWGELDRLRWRIKPRNTVLWTVDTWSGPKNYGEAVSWSWSHVAKDVDGWL